MYLLLEESRIKPNKHCELSDLVVSCKNKKGGGGKELLLENTVCCSFIVISLKRCANSSKLSSGMRYYLSFLTVVHLLE